jgi:uncharacterized membrane protein YphA (DoxX/SURF4 family)
MSEMDTVGLVAALVTGAVFVLAGASKLALGRAWPAQAGELGVPSPVAVVVPWVELAIGAALVVRLAGALAAVAAIALLAVFTILIAVNLRAGRAPVCACFGAWSATPLGRGHLLRNGALTAVAVLALWA